MGVKLEDADAPCIIDGPAGRHTKLVCCVGFSSKPPHQIRLGPWAALGSTGPVPDAAWLASSREVGINATLLGSHSAHWPRATDRAPGKRVSEVIKEQWNCWVRIRVINSAVSAQPYYPYYKRSFYRLPLTCTTHMRHPGSGCARRSSSEPHLLKLFSCGRRCGWLVEHRRGRRRQRRPGHQRSIRPIHPTTKDPRWAKTRRTRHLATWPSPFHSELRMQVSKCAW